MPALLFYFLLIWNELLSGGQAAIPHHLADLAVGYSVFTITGAIIFGDKWFRYGEVFSVFFDLVSRVSIFEINASKVYLIPPFMGLLKRPAEGFSQIAFIVFLLASTAYDGFRGTSIWLQLDLGLSRSTKV